MLILGASRLCVPPSQLPSLSQPPPPWFAMSKSSKKVERGSRKVTEFFPRRSSAISSSQPPSSQPPSSPAQMTAPKLGATQRQAAASTGIPSKLEEEIIILSSDSGPITVSSASSHISISSDTHSVILVSDSSGPKENFAKRVIAKDSTPARQVMKSSVNAPAPTGAQTRVKRRTAAPVDPPLLTLPRAIPPRKRKLQWESSSDEGPAIPNPDKMKPSLACAPASRATLHSVSLPLAPMENTPSTPSKRYESGPSTPSKRARLSLREPPGLSNTSGNDADIEEIPSSQSDEHELTIPKTAKKDPAEVKERVDQWRRESSVVVSPNIRATSSPSEVAPLGSTLSSPLSSAVDIPYDSPEDSVLSSFPGIHDHMDVDEDIHQSPISPDLLIVENATGARTPKSEAEVSQQLYIRSSTPAFSSGSLSHAISPATSPQPHSQIRHPTEISPLDSITDALRPLTPPPMVALQELRATPVALDPKTKAEEMIAQIKAAAYAAVQSSPEEVPLDFNILDVASSSEDEDSDFHVTRKR
ncbi:hypothetical protein PHLCEN_2v6481 [Hermanssonia centrifuga]|uniref:Uncharacterized protein n=1 Tax=Hermanssonia centrifuga TaxID=98765 RepID=A0A2R6NZ81_9APHY|nr:hypothetical protein PHLCEN_2v6481 [Hermanssonia centrifuga]